MERHEDNYPFPKDGAGDAMPIDLQLDLLVDEELPEEQRRALLLWLDANPQRWRDLSIRFLQRQVENKAVGDLLASKTSGMTVRPVRPRRSGARRYMAVAAGLLVAIGSAMVVVHLLGPGPETKSPTPGPVTKAEVITTPLPGSLWNTKGTQSVTVPVTSSDTPVLFPANGANASAQKRTVVITPDGTQNAIIIPVTNLQYQ